MEPTLSHIDDYNNQGSPQKRRTVSLIIATIMVVGIAFSTVKYYYDRHTPQCFNPIVYR